MKPDVAVVEVGPRDGLQNETVTVPTATKVQFIEALAAAGHGRIEATSFVSPQAVPQLADAGEVMGRLARSPATTYLALVPNEKGMERALAAGVDEVAIFTAASESFCRRNIKASIDESFARFEPVAARARAAGIPLRGYVSTALYCPYEGLVDPARTLAVARRLLELGCYEVSLGETLGRATPKEARVLLRLLRTEGCLDRCAVHFHDTYGMGLANVLAALEEGVRVFDASAGGLGGCPFAPGAAGNVATEDVLHLFRGLGLRTGIDLQKQVAATVIIEQALGRLLPGRTYRALKSRPG